MNFMSVVEQVCVLGIVMSFGYIICKTGYVQAKAKDSISKLIVNLILPCLIISSISKQEFKSEMLGEISLVFVMSVFCISTLFFIGAVLLASGAHPCLMGAQVQPFSTTNEPSSTRIVAENVPTPLTVWER